jgi:prepilin-type N-terminal cleavage/methylation domain-containing protein
MRPGRTRQRGMTLLEVMIVTAIIGLAIGVSIMAVRHVTKTALREDTNRVAQLMRAAQNMAQLSGKQHRVVFDLEKQQYRIEQCGEAIALKKSDKEAEPLEEVPEEIAQAAAAAGVPQELLTNVDPEMAAKLGSALAGRPLGQGPGSGCQVPTLPNGDADGRGNERQMNTDDDIKIRRVIVQHLEDPVLDGVVMVHFFPLGNAEKSMVVIGDDDGNYFTLLVHPFTGRVEMRKGEVDADDYMRRDAAGNRVEER